MAITDFMDTDFQLQKRSEAKVSGRLQRTYTLDENLYKCAIFTPTTARTVRFGKQDFVISKNLYCEVAVTIDLGDIITVDGQDFDVILLTNTNNLNHHLVVGLTSKETA